MDCRRLRANFILPSLSALPVGGYKVEYQYADRLVCRGHAATVLHAWSSAPRLPTGGLLRFLGKTALLKASGAPIVPWYDFEAGTTVKLFPSLYRSAGIPRADITILTAWQTAAYLPPSPKLGRLVQVVYDYELWRTADLTTRAAMARAFRRPGVVRIATSKAVCTMLEEAGSDWSRILNPGIDLMTFSQLRQPKDRRPTIGFALRGGAKKGARKGMDTLLRALELVHRRFPEVSVVCFGAESEDVAHWIHSRGFVSTADLVAIYNESSIFVLPSRYEGWGLPALEAMACGACVVSTRNGGVEDFCVDGINARLVNPDDPVGLATVIGELLSDPADRIRIAEEGVRVSQQYGLVTATNKFVDVIEDLATGLHV